MRTRLLSLNLLLILAPCIRAEEPVAGKELFPLTLGNQWTYRIQGQNDRLTVKVEAEEAVGEARCMPLEGKLQNRVIVRDLITIKKDGAYRCRLDNADIDPPMLICKFPPERGAKWRADYKINDKKASIDYECDEEEVTVMGSKYKAVVIRSESSDGKLRSTVWYVPKIGMVKQVSEDGDGKITLSLDRYEHAGDAKGPPKKGAKQ